ncbi:tetrapyrrole biosynthesis, uroporphyrinogen III synthase [Aspergillus transmontanensis]|uniref:Tetrapyrrole biosynthesis, uroporphyrinogen III synthase n=1 Tax=Aspergillus transmontanensis TaxID=1034304 RepID=A0A5N6WGI4_9EURO|nr:tetrapyrrole biosynthesis, uroporphyrinogen III synthase [Aspergillus transmontanensis]
MPPQFTFNTSSTPILLLKTKSSPTDSYEEYFSAHSYTPTFIPVLEHNFHTPNLTTVKQLFQSGALNPGPGRKYGGLIFTSQRAVEGFATILNDIDESTKQTSSQSLILYTVGPATSRSLTSIRDDHLPHATILGSETGNGENLAHFILSHYNPLYDSQDGPKPPLLFLVGEQRRDIIPKMLMARSLPPEQRIGVDELVVYETGVMEGFEESFGKAVRASEEFLGGAVERAVWVVVFSPTGCDAMVRVLKGLGDGERRVFVATIGPTTRDHLKNKYGFEADVCAEKPSQEGVGMGIVEFMENWRKNRAGQ